jgi:hypothetical protein
MTFASAASLAAAGALALSGGATKVTLTAAGHSPKIKVHWPYTVTATSGGKPVAAKLSVAIVDPIGGVHPVQFGASKKYVTNWPFKGTFHDYLIWPADSAVGVPLVVRATVKIGKTTKVVSYKVTPKK